MSIKKSFLFVLISSILLLYIIFISFEIPAKFYPVLDGSNMPIGEITKSIHIGQTFVSERSNLNRVDILFATYGRKNTEEVIFYLRENSDRGRDIVVYKFNAKSIENNKYFSITFPEISDSRGKYYYFYLESPNSKVNNAITVWYLPNNSYAMGDLLINGTVVKGDLLFRPYFKTNIIEYMDILLERMQMNKPWFYNKSSFIILFLLFFSSVVLAAIWFLEKPPQE
jgi:hypothetical protein